MDVSRASWHPGRVRGRVGGVALLVALAVGALGATAAAGSPASARPAGPWRVGSFAVGDSAPVLVGVRDANGTPAYVAWIDHTRTRLALYPGTQEPPQASPRGPAMVPASQRSRLLATFNGGFKAAAGVGGFLVNGHADEPLKAGMGTLVEYRDGSLAILDWRGGTPPSTLVLARQNLPPLAWAGRPTALVANNAAWGATLGGGAAVWRTAVGVTKAGDLVYAAAGNQTAASLARLMVSIGADRAIELDINPEWPSFITYGRPGAGAPLKLVPNSQQGTLRYLTPDKRDFFAVFTRAGGGPLVPFR